MNVFYKNKESGVALITAMLLMVIGALLATRITWDNQLNIRRATIASDMDQAKLFAMGAEAIAIAAIREDSNNTDNLIMTSPATHETGQGLMVAQELPIGIGDQNMGTMIGKLEDLQGRFNLNALIKSDGSPDNKSKEVFSRLLQKLKLDSNIVYAAIDWMDPDGIPSQGGAEDGYYTSLDPPYRPPNRNFTHISELRAVAGVGENEYKILRNYLTALPQRGCSASEDASSEPSININFAPAELIMALSESITPSIAQSWQQASAQEGLSSIDQLTSMGADTDIRLLAQDNYLGFSTHCFGLKVYVSIGNSLLTMYSVIERTGQSGKDIFVRQRIFGVDTNG